MLKNGLKNLITTHKKQYEMVNPKIIPIRLIPEYHDTDFDGVPNYRDCNPWNPHEHIFEKYMMEEKDMKGNVLARKIVSKKELLDMDSWDIFGVPFSRLDSQTKRKLKDRYK